MPSTAEGALPVLEFSEGKQLRAHRSWTPLARALTATGDRWTLMIVVQLAPGSMRLSQLQRCLPGVSTGVLERYVQRMDALGLLTRRRFRELPPRVELELTSAGRELLPVAGALARWGMRNIWSDPRESERVSVTLLLCLLPVLLEEQANLASGSVAMSVSDEEQPEPLLFEIYKGRLRRRADESPREPNADVRIASDRDGWIAALGGRRDYARLRIAGAQSLAIGILEALPRRMPEETIAT